VADLASEEKPFLNGFAHDGILAGAKTILDKTNHVLRTALQQHLGYNLMGRYRYRLSKMYYCFSTLVHLSVYHNFFAVDSRSSRHFGFFSQKVKCLQNYSSTIQKHKTNYSEIKSKSHVLIVASSSVA
jgi:hypothetical protein